MKLGWAALDAVSADRVWLRPSGLISGRAAAEAIAFGHARPLTGPSLAFSLIAALGLGSDLRPDALGGQYLDPHAARDGIKAINSWPMTDPEEVRYEQQARR